jgi:transposase-like protein
VLGYIFIFGGLIMRKTKEQKELAVKRYLSGESATAVISEIGISRSALYLWVKQFREVQKDKGNVISIVSYKRLQGKVKRL